MEQQKDPLAWEEIETEHIVQDQWIDFRRTTYRYPDGRVFAPFYSYTKRDYVVIVASDEAGRYLCVRQFRQGIRAVTTEFPAGGIEKDAEGHSEDILEAARRELLEETGYASDEWKHLLSIPSHPTISDNYAHFFVARNCRKVADQSLDETEVLNILHYTAAQIEDLIARGDFQQPDHVAAWLLSLRR